MKKYEIKNNICIIKDFNSKELDLSGNNIKEYNRFRELQKFRKISLQS